MSNQFTNSIFQYHHDFKTGKRADSDPDFDRKQEIWLSIFGLGKLETFQFIYGACDNAEHFTRWITALKGADFVEQATLKFNQWTQNNLGTNHKISRSLSAEQLKFWEINGYLKVSDLFPDQHCEDVKQLICNYLKIDLSKPETWYFNHENWHGLMVQLYQDKAINEIRYNTNLFNLFAELYNSADIIANVDKLSFNPPETDKWRFSHDKLHWDIDFDRLDEDYIQGLVYLDDVPENRGAFKAVPGFHAQFQSWIKSFENLQDAHIKMREEQEGTFIPGKKGDVILWRNTLPHAASKNKSTLPRFVQYVSFSKL